jgi:diguanylate cyclase (GGDEF)-like protein
MTERRSRGRLRDRVKDGSPRADNPAVKFDLAHPTQHQVREGLISGLIAESIAVPILLTVVFFDHHQTRWGYLVGAIACLFASAVYLALFSALTRGKASIASQAKAGFVMVCLALSALGFLELGTSDSYGILAPAAIVGVVFICVIGDRTMRVAIALYAITLVGIMAWAAGLRGATFVGALVINASTIIIVTWIISRTVGRLNDRVNFRRSIALLNEALDDDGTVDTDANADLIKDALRRGLPLVPTIIPTYRVSVFTQDARLDKFTLLATSPAGEGGAVDAAEGPQLDRALRTGSVVVTESVCVIPIGYFSEGEMVMVVHRLPPSKNSDHLTADAAEAIAAAFLRVTNRINFVSGLQSEIRTDPLTGLANRRILFERIQIEMDHAIRSESPLSVAMIDLDHFKDYNDQFGHVAGDTLLRSIAAVMVSNIRGQDLVARYGGEEFCLVMPETDLVGGHHLLDKLRGGGRDATSDFGVTLSAGLTSWDGFESTTSLIERADQALYRAKESGRDRVVSIQAFTEF